MKLDKVIFLTNFIVLDMKEDKEIPLILERSFLSRERTLIDVQQGKLRLRIDDEHVTFDVFKFMNLTSKVHSCFQISVLDLVVVKTYRVRISNFSLEICLTHSSTLDYENEEISKCLKY